MFKAAFILLDTLHSKLELGKQIVSFLKVKEKVLIAQSIYASYGKV